MLRGRDDDLATIIDDVHEHALVVLHGYSGCGKSSLLMAGLYNDLIDENFAVLVARKWGGSTGALDAEQMVKDAIDQTCADPRVGLTLPDGIDLDNVEERGGLCWALDELYGASAVVIFDRSRNYSASTTATSRDASSTGSSRADIDITRISSSRCGQIACTSSTRC